MEFYIFPLLILLLSTFLFHTLFIKFHPRGKAFWIKVDYYWVCLAFIGVIGSTYSLRHELASGWIPWNKSTVAAYYQYLQEESDFECQHFSKLDYESFTDTNAKIECQQARDFYCEFSNKIVEYKADILEHNSYHYIDSLDRFFTNFVKLGSDNRLDNASGVKSYFEILEEVADGIGLQERLSQKSILDYILMYFSPVLFSLAIALRLTKVTFQLREVNDR